MKRQSRLPVLVRLARLEENKTLRALGEVRGAVEQTRRSIETLNERLERGRLGTLLTPGRKMRADQLSAHAAAARGLVSGIQTLENTLQEAQTREDDARDKVVKAKLRVRALRNVQSQREERERLEARRAEMRQLDEMTRLRVQPEEF